MLSSVPYYLSYILSREHDTALKDINKLREAVSVFQLKLACEYFKFANYHNIDGCDTPPIWYGLMASNTIEDAQAQALAKSFLDFYDQSA